jgi:hypothetical protein
MNSWKRRFAAMALTVCCFVFARPIFAAPAKADHVAADAKWYIHLDLDAAKETTIYAQVLDAVKAQFPLEDVLAQVKATIGVNPLTDISGATVYSTSIKKEDKDSAAIIIYAKIDAALLNNVLAQSPDYKETPYGKHTLLSWTDMNDGKHKNGCFYGEGVVLMADKIETLKPAIDVLDGTKPGGSSLVKTPQKGAFLCAAADLSQSDDPNIAQLLSSSEPATASAAEVEGNFVLTLNATAKTDQQAAQIKQMLDGVKAFGQLGARDVPTAAAMIGKVQIVTDGAKVVASFQHEAKTLLETLQKIDAENKAKAAKKPAAPNGL